MTEEANVDAQAQAAPGVLVADAEGLLAAVEDRVKERTEAGDVLEAAVEHFVDARIERRAELLRGALDRVKKLTKERNGIKPNAKGYTQDGEKVEGEVYTKAQADRIQQISQELDPIVEAIAEQNYNKLSKLGF